MKPELECLERRDCPSAPEVMTPVYAGDPTGAGQHLHATQLLSLDVDPNPDREVRLVDLDESDSVDLAVVVLDNLDITSCAFSITALRLLPETGSVIPVISQDPDTTMRISWMDGMPMGHWLLSYDLGVTWNDEQLWDFPTDNGGIGGGGEEMGFANIPDNVLTPDTTTKTVSVPEVLPMPEEEPDVGDTIWYDDALLALLSIQRQGHV